MTQKQHSGPEELGVEEKRRRIEYIQKRVEILKGFEPGQILDGNDPIIQKLSKMLELVLIEMFGQGSAGFERFGHIIQIDRIGRRPGVSPAEFRRGLEAGKADAIAALEAMIRSLIKGEEHAATVAAPAPAPITAPAGQPAKKVFLACGNDPELKKTLERLLGDLGLRTVPVGERGEKARTIMETVEANPDAKAAIVAVVDSGEQEEGQPSGIHAVQQTIYALGYLTGKFGRGKVLALKVKEDKDISEVRGVKYVYLDEEGKWVASLVKDIGTAGIYLDQEKVKKVLQ